MSYVDEAGRPVDVFGRPDLHSPLIGLLRAVPGLREQFKPVPDSYFTVVDGEARVTCPCAQTPGLPVRLVAACGGLDGCGRVYLWTGKALFAARGMTDAEWAEFQAEPLSA